VSRGSRATTLRHLDSLLSDLFLHPDIVAALDSLKSVYMCPTLKRRRTELGVQILDQHFFVHFVRFPVTFENFKGFFQGHLQFLAHEVDEHVASSVQAVRAVDSNEIILLQVSVARLQSLAHAFHIASRRNSLASAVHLEMCLESVIVSNHLRLFLWVSFQLKLFFRRVVLVGVGQVNDEL